MNDRVIPLISLSAFNQDADIWHRSRLIHAFAGGSALHGASLGKADLDIYGVFIEPLVNIYGLTRFEHFVSSTGTDQSRNTPDDVDITLYSLRRWAGLAVKGNPTALSFLFAPNEAGVMWDSVDVFSWGQVKDALREAVVCKRSVNAFRGFVTDQMKRLLGEKGQGKHGQRPELTADFGYDTKAVMHASRLTFEAIELMNTGHITYPRPEVEYLRSIRRGELSLDKVCANVSESLRCLENAERDSLLQEKPNYAAVDSVLVNAYTEFYS
jgi:predicted nucleotidyltransferase